MPDEDNQENSVKRPIVALLDLIGQKWTLRILWELRDGRLSFRALQARCERLSPTVLNARLKDLRAGRLVDLNEDGFGLTALGVELAGQLLTLNDWAKTWARTLETSVMR